MNHAYRLGDEPRGSDTKGTAYLGDVIALSGHYVAYSLVYEGDGGLPWAPVGC